MEASGNWHSEFCHSSQWGSSAPFQYTQFYEHYVEQIIRVNAEVARLSYELADMNNELLNLKRENYELKHELARVKVETNKCNPHPVKYGNNIQKNHSNVYYNDKCAPYENRMDEPSKPTVRTLMEWRRKQKTPHNLLQNLSLRRSPVIRTRNRRNDKRRSSFRRSHHPIFVNTLSYAWDKLRSTSNCVLHRKGLGNLKKEDASSGANDDESDDDDDHDSDDKRQLDAPSETNGGQDGRLLEI